MATMTAPRTAVVRFHTAPSPVRAAFRVLERAAPALGARWAERIWFTLPPPKKYVSFDAVPGTPFAVDGIAGEEFGAGPAIYLVHGWAGQRGQLAAFVRPLVERGFRVVTFDAPSHGRSGPGVHGPRSSSVPEFTAAFRAVVAARGPAHAVVAHSAGATAVATALCDGVRTRRLVMLAPMASPARYVRRLVAALGAGERIRERLTARSERRIGAPLHHFDVPELGRAVAMPPTLVVHDERDPSIPVSDGEAIVAAWPSARLHVTSGLGHRRLLREPGVVAEVVDFITGPISSPPWRPSGSATAVLTCRPVS